MLIGVRRLIISAARAVYREYRKLGFPRFFEVFPTHEQYSFFPKFKKIATSFVNTASTRRIDPYQPDTSNSKNEFSKFMIFVYFSQNHPS